MPTGYGHIAQSVTCPGADTCLTADHGVTSSTLPAPWRMIMKQCLTPLSH